MFESTKDCLEKGQKVEMESEGTKILKEHLEKLQASLDSTKDCLLIEKQKSKELEKSNYLQDKELTWAKLDLRIITREKKDLENKLTKQADDYLLISAKLEQLEVQSKETETKANQLEKELRATEAKLKEADEAVLKLKKSLVETEQAKKELEDKMEQLQLGLFFLHKNYNI
jgi:chromosome segregation ATPase